MSAGVFAGTTNNLKLAWDYPTNAISDNLVFKLHYTTNLYQPLTNWGRIFVSATNAIALTNAAVAGTNYVFTNSLPVEPGAWFFIATATNEWGESDPSNVAATPPLPRKTQLGIVRL